MCICMRVCACLCVLCVLFCACCFVRVVLCVLCVATTTLRASYFARWQRFPFSVCLLCTELSNLKSGYRSTCLF
jgi:hypothetical protein